MCSFEYILKSIDKFKIFYIIQYLIAFLVKFKFELIILTLINNLTILNYIFFT